MTSSIESMLLSRRVFGGLLVTAIFFASLGCVSLTNAPVPQVRTGSSPPGAPDDPVITSQYVEAIEIGQQEGIEIYEKINRALPGPDPKSAGKPTQLIEVSRTGLLTFAGGERMRLAGLLCTEGLRKALGGSSGRLASPLTAVTLPIGASQDQASPAYVWLVTEIDAERRSYASLNDLATHNRWCVPIQETGHKYYERYIALWIFDHRFPL
jgi:hypothetical protein